MQGDSIELEGARTVSLAENPGLSVQRLLVTMVDIGGIKLSSIRKFCDPSLSVENLAVCIIHPS
jgi:hypothetical protein